MVVSKPYDTLNLDRFGNEQTTRQNRFRTVGFEMCDYVVEKGSELLRTVRLEQDFSSFQSSPFAPCKEPAFSCLLKLSLSLPLLSSLSPIVRFCLSDQIRTPPPCYMISLFSLAIRCSNTQVARSEASLSPRHFKPVSSLMLQSQDRILPSINLYCTKFPKEPAIVISLTSFRVYQTA